MDESIYSNEEKFVLEIALWMEEKGYTNFTNF